MKDIKVIKRDGREVEFDINRIKNALVKAFKDTVGDIDEERVTQLSKSVVRKINQLETDKVSVEEIQNLVENVLITNKELDVAKDYIKYRAQRTEIREANSDLMKEYWDITFKEAEEVDSKRDNANVDGNTAMGTMLQYGAAGSKRFCVKNVLKSEHAEAHRSGLIHIHDMDFESIGTLTCLVGNTYITLKDKDGNIINTTIEYFDKIFEQKDNINPEWKDINNYYILGRNGWTKLEKVMRRKINKDDKLYNLKTHKGLGLKVTENHRIPVIRNGVEELLQVKDITIGDSLLNNPRIDICDSRDTLNLAEEFLDSQYLENKNNIMICNIRKLKQYMMYKYEINNLSKLLNSNISRNGTSYITLEQFKYLTDNYDIPYEVLITLEITMRNSKHSLPVIYPITNELMTIMGYIFGDGSINKWGTGAVICNVDPLKLQYFKKCYDKICLTPLSWRGDKKKNYQTGWLINNSIFSLLISRVLGYKKYSNEMLMPNMIFNLSDELKFSFISGLTDTDGCCTQGWSYGTVCKEFAEQLVNLLKTLNIDTKAEFTPNKGTFTGFTGSYRNYDGYKIRLTDAKNISIILKGLNGVKQNQNLINDLAYIGNTVKFDVNKIKDKILIEEDCYVYDLQTVEHWFIANNYVVHNCCQIDLEKLFKDGFSTGHGHLREPQDIMSYAALAAIAVQSNQNDQHGGQSIPNFDYGLAPGVSKTFIRLYKDNLIKAMMLLIDYDELAAKTVVDKVVPNYNEEGNYPSLEEEHYFMTYKVTEHSKLFEEFEPRNTSYMDKIDDIQRFAYKMAKKETIKKTYQAMEGFLHNLNTMHSRAGAQVPFSSINFGTDTSAEGRLITEQFLLSAEAGLGNRETAIFPISCFKVKEGINYNPTDPNYDLFKLAIRVSAKRLFPNFVFIDAPHNIQYYKPGRPETEIVAMGCRTRVIGSVFEESDGIVYGRGNNSFTSINLPRLGIKYGICLNKRDKADMKGFYGELDKTMDLVIDQLLERYKIQCNKKVKNFPFLMGQKVWFGSEELNWDDTLEKVIKHGTLTVGFIGLAETLIALIGKHHGESKEAQQLGLEIIKHMREYMDKAAKQYTLNFSLIATPAEGLSGRFIRIDKNIFGEIAGITDKDYYTNSFHVPVYFNINANDKIEIEAPYHALTNAGHITYIELDGDPSKNLEAFEMIIRRMKEVGIGYGSINHPLDRDPICGFNGVIGDRCPGCGRLDGEHGPKFERIRRITGYLVGTVDRWNDAKQSELKDRIKHKIKKDK